MKECSLRFPIPAMTRDHGDSGDLLNHHRLLFLRLLKLDRLLEVHH